MPTTRMVSDSSNMEASVTSKVVEVPLDCFSKAVFTVVLIGLVPTE